MESPGPPQPHSTAAGVLQQCNPSPAGASCFACCGHCSNNGVSSKYRDRGLCVVTSPRAPLTQPNNSGRCCLQQAGQLSEAVWQVQSNTRQPLACAWGASATPAASGSATDVLQGFCCLKKFLQGSRAAQAPRKNTQQQATQNHPSGTVVDNQC